MSEKAVVVSDEMHLAARVMLTTMEGGLERKRRIWKLRAEVARLTEQLGHARAQLEVEEREQADEGNLVREMFEQWKADLAEAKSPTETK